MTAVDVVDGARPNRAGHWGPEDLRETGHHSREGTHLVAHPLSNEKRSPIKRRLPLLPAMVN